MTLPLVAQVSQENLKWPHPTQFTMPCVYIKQVQCLGHGSLREVRRGQSCLCYCQFPFKLTEEKQDRGLDVTVWHQWHALQARLVGAEFKADPGKHHTTEEELGMPWMMALVGVPLMALKM